MHEYNVHAANGQLAATLKLLDNDVHVHIAEGHEELAATLSVLLRLSALALPVADDLPGGTQAVRVDKVTIDDPRWPSALAWALGTEYTVSPGTVAGDESTVGAENEKNGGIGDA